jgi:hypothetical protein
MGELLRRYWHPIGLMRKLKWEYAASGVETISARVLDDGSGTPVWVGIDLRRAAIFQHDPG